jgi:hypothetical protein
MEMLSSTSVLLVHEDWADSFVSMCVITISGTVVTFNTKYTLIGEENPTAGIRLTALSSTKAVVAFTRTNANTNAIVLSISGTVITTNSEYTAFTTDGISILKALSSTTFVIGTSNTRMKIGTVSGTTISYGSQSSTYETGSYIIYTSVVVLSSTSFVVTYTFNKNGKSVVCSVSGTTITVNTPYTFRTSEGAAYDTMFDESSLIDSTNYVIAYRYYGNMYAITAKIDGTAITFSSTSIVVSTNVNDINISVADATTFLVAYSTSTYGKSRVGIISADGKKINNIIMAKFNSATILKWNNQ